MQLYYTFFSTKPFRNYFEYKYISSCHVSNDAENTDLCYSHFEGTMLNQYVTIQLEKFVGE